MRMWMNSKLVGCGDLFLVDSNNKKYVNEAINNGAYKIISELDDNYFHVDDIKSYFYDYYKDKIKDVTLIGVTGTNGKTTTCFLIYQMLNMIGIKTAFIGTIGFYIEDKIINTRNTTPSMDLLYNFILTAKEKDCKVVVMEVSSHALKQDRVYGLAFDAIGVTNITKEHLDYHKTMKDYLNTKKKLVSKLCGYRICVLNKFKHYKRFLNKKNNNYVLGKDIKIINVKEKLDGTDIFIKDNKKLIFKISLIGNYNVSNFLMAYKIIDSLGYDTKKMIKNSYKLLSPPGRMQKVCYKDNVIFVDYAHTPDAVLNVLSTVNKIKNKGIITILGCGGNRDKTKRPIMGKIAVKNSLYVIFTNDNPRLEDPKKIIDDITFNLKGNYEVIYDRYEAIKRGISLLKSKMILMVLGKGHEDYQIIGKDKIFFSDIDSVNDIVKQKLK